MIGESKGHLSAEELRHDLASLVDSLPKYKSPIGYAGSARLISIVRKYAPSNNTATEFISLKNEQRFNIGYDELIELHSKAEILAIAEVDALPQNTYDEYPSSKYWLNLFRLKHENQHAILQGGIKTLDIQGGKLDR